MAEFDRDQKDRVIAFCVLALFGLFMFGQGISHLIKNGLTHKPFDDIGLSFVFWALAASPKVMLKSVLDTSKSNYSKLSKALFLIAILNVIASLILRNNT